MTITSHDDNLDIMGIENAAKTINGSLANMGQDFIHMNQEGLQVVTNVTNRGLDEVQRFTFGVFNFLDSCQKVLDKASHEWNETIRYCVTTVCVCIFLLLL